MDDIKTLDDFAAHVLIGMSNSHYIFQCYIGKDGPQKTCYAVTDKERNLEFKSENLGDCRYYITREQKENVIKWVR